MSAGQIKAAAVLAIGVLIGMYVANQVGAGSWLARVA